MCLILLYVIFPLIVIFGFQFFYWLASNSIRFSSLSSETWPLYQSFEWLCGTEWSRRWHSCSRQSFSTCLLVASLPSNTKSVLMRKRGGERWIYRSWKSWSSSLIIQTYCFTTNIWINMWLDERISIWQPPKQLLKCLHRCHLLQFYKMFIKDLEYLEEALSPVWMCTWTIHKVRRETGAGPIMQA